MKEDIKEKTLRILLNNSFKKLAAHFTKKIIQGWEGSLDSYLGTFLPDPGY